MPLLITCTAPLLEQLQKISNMLNKMKRPKLICSTMIVGTITRTGCFTFYVPNKKILFNTKRNVSSSAPTSCTTIRKLSSLSLISTNKDDITVRRNVSILNNTSTGRNMCSSSRNKYATLNLQKKKYESQFLDEVEDTIHEVFLKHNIKSSLLQKTEIATNNNSGTMNQRIDIDPIIHTLHPSQRQAVGVAIHLHNRIFSLTKNNDCRRCWLQTAHLYAIKHRH
mmetsp:Transcript_15146/g.18448  ORF Transcript_15146/g.18448 Transcript_15146/m.18448 type:complete len:224 (-) Transcript_15146:692-1363(-)